MVLAGPSILIENLQINSIYGEHLITLRSSVRFTRHCLTVRKLFGHYAYIRTVIVPQWRRYL